MCRVEDSEGQDEGPSGVLLLRGRIPQEDPTGPAMSVMENRSCSTLPRLLFTRG